MKKTHTAGCGFVRALTGLAAAAFLLAWQGSSFANSPNTMPYSESFESIAPGTVIVDTNGAGIRGWYGGEVSTSDLAVVVNSVSTYGGAFPIPGSHTNIMSFSCSSSITNVFTPVPPSPFLTNVTIDTMLQSGFLNSNPSTDPSFQCAVYVNTNGHLVVRHAKYVNNLQNVIQEWTELINGPDLTSNQWVRLTIKMDYLSAGIYADQEHYFQISADGGAPISDPEGYLTIAGLEQGGTFFLCADSGGSNGQVGPNNKYFSSLGLMGIGNIDDLVINPSETNAPPPAKPKIVAVASGPGGTSHGLAWQSLAGKQYSVFRSTDLKSTNPVPGGWVLQTNNIPADVSGTNIWLDTSLPQSPTNATFYKTLEQP